MLLRKDANCINILKVNVLPERIINREFCIIISLMEKVALKFI